MSLKWPHLLCSFLVSNAFMYNVLLVSSESNLYIPLHTTEESLIIRWTFKGKFDTECALECRKEADTDPSLCAGFR